MQVNIYAEDLTDHIQIVRKEIDKRVYTGACFYLELPVTIDDKQVCGRFLHGPDADDSSVVTFWGKQQLCRFLARTILILDQQTQAK